MPMKSQRAFFLSIQVRQGWYKLSIHYRDVKAKSEKRFDLKQDKRNQFRAVITDNLGNQSGAGSIWYDQPARRVWAMPVGGTQPSIFLCVRLTPVIGLGVIVGYADPLSRTLEVLRTDYEFLGPSNTTGTAYESPSNEDFLPGGRLQLWLDPRLMQPLATYPDATGLTVNVVSGDYLYAGERVSFAGQTGIALTQNPNPGEHYLAGLYLDAANALNVTYGASVVIATTAPQPTWPAGAFQLSTVQIDDTQTLISMALDVSNRRILWTDEDSFSGGGAWPAPNTLKIGTTEYATLALAIAAAVSGDTIYAGVGTFTSDNLTLPASVNLWGADRYRTIFTSSAASTTLTLSANCKIGNITITNTRSIAAVTQAIAIASSGVTLTRVIADVNNATSVGNGCEMTSGGNATLYDCEMTADGQAFLITSATANIHGGTFSKFETAAGSTTRFYNLPQITSASFAVAPTGWYSLSGDVIAPNSSLQIRTGATITSFSTDGTLAANSDALVPTQKAVKTYADTKIPATIVDAKGDIIAATAADTVARLAAGADGTFLQYDSSQTTGLRSAAIRNDNLLYHSLNHDIWPGGVTFADLADDSYVSGVWNVVSSANTPDISGEAGGSTDDFTRCFRCTMDAASQQAGIVQFRTAEDTRDLRGAVVSLSFDAWGTNITALRAAVIYWTSTADTLTSDVVGTWATGNQTLATNWAYANTPAADITISGTKGRYKVEGITIPTNANNVAVFIWTPNAEASGDLFNIANVKLEIGAIATPFSSPGYKEEESRTYQFSLPLKDILGGYVPCARFGTQDVVAYMVSPVFMFKTPTLINASDLSTTLGTGAKQVDIYNLASSAALTATGNVTLSIVASRASIALDFTAATSFSGTAGAFCRVHQTASDLLCYLSAQL